MQESVGLHTIVEIATGLMVFAGFVTTLMIRNNQSTVKEELVSSQNKIKEELVSSQNEMREDMDAKHAENSKAIAVHQASDEAKFDAISRTLTRIDGKLDRNFNNGTH